MGIAKLYRHSDGQFVTYADYKLFQDPATINWRGELTPLDSVRLDDGDRFIIEFEDKRRSQCYLQRRVNRAVSGIPPRYVYHITGFGPTKR